jgi:putative endonuclease
VKNLKTKGIIRRVYTERSECAQDDKRGLMNYFVYMMSNRNNKVLYCGVTNNLVRRVYEHKNKIIEGFTKKYNVGKLVFHESFNNINDAIAAEKRIKGWVRRKKNELIEKNNPEWRDLSEEILR